MPRYLRKALFMDTDVPPFMDPRAIRWLAKANGSSRSEMEELLNMLMASS